MADEWLLRKEKDELGGVDRVCERTGETGVDQQGGTRIGFSCLSRSAPCCPRQTFEGKDEVGPDGT